MWTKSSRIWIVPYHDAQNLGMVQKVCFVTIGATAAFDQLLKAVLSSQFVQALQSLGYTSLRLQYGKNGQNILADLETQSDASKHGVEITGFDFNTKGLGQEMWCTKAGEDRVEGIVISHAGMLYSLSLTERPPSLFTTLSLRFWLDPRCSTYSRTAHRGPKYFTVTQSSGRIGGGIVKAGFCSPRSLGVRRWTHH